ncbi:hypothetical protein DL96DRAFT_1821574 [Flagelloscypha sp. PMI_526]|nr:hypothetical protein DL96DRAFT_1821574 [Flagelloscypha sp. PMI_526]
MFFTTVLVISISVLPTAASYARTGWSGWLTNPDDPADIDVQGQEVNGDFFPWKATWPQAWVGWTLGGHLGSDWAKWAWRLNDVGDSSTIVFKTDFAVPPAMNVTFVDPTEYYTAVWLGHTVKIMFPTPEQSGSESGKTVLVKNKKVKRELWDDATFAPLPWPTSYSASVDTGPDCPTTLKLTVTVTDIHGITRSASGSGSVDLLIDENELVHPINLTITSDPDYGSVYAQLSGESQVVYALAEGEKAPTLVEPTKSLSASICLYDDGSD